MLLQPAMLRWVAREERRGEETADLGRRRAWKEGACRALHVCCQQRCELCSALPPSPRPPRWAEHTASEGAGAVAAGGEEDSE
eukprot:1015014-Rhodomonas_salina.1